MTLDDVYGPEHDRFPLEQERAPVARKLEWSDQTNGARPRPGRVVDAALSRVEIAVLLQAPLRAA